MVSVDMPRYESAGDYTVYIIRTTVDGETYTTRQRFSAFLQMHGELKSSIAFPCAKKWFHPLSVKEDRRARFETYLNELLAPCTPEKVPKRLAHFLEMPVTQVRTETVTVGTPITVERVIERPDPPDRATPRRLEEDFSYQAVEAPPTPTPATPRPDGGNPAVGTYASRSGASVNEGKTIYKGPRGGLYFSRNSGAKAFMSSEKSAHCAYF
jgi:hypothetical protein